MDEINIPKIGMTVFLLVDASERVNACYEEKRNAVLSELQPLISNLALDEETDVAIKTYYFKELSNMYTLLKKRLSSKADLVWERNYVPIMLLMSDGKQVESIADYRYALDALRSNNWFKAALKVAVDLTDDSDNLILNEFTGNREAVLNANHVDDLRHIFKKINITTCGPIELDDCLDTNFDDWE